MKKITGCFIALFVLFACGAFTACDGGHQHEYTTNFDESGHWQECICAERVAFSEHNYGDPYVINSAGCESVGENGYSCVDCSYEKREEAPATGHDVVVHEGKAATCAEAGYQPYETCNNCNYTTYEAIPKNEDHNWTLRDWETLAPTCLEEGSNFYECSVCYQTKTEVVGVVACHPVYNYTGTDHWQECEWCGTGKTEEEAHDYSTENDCSVCGYKHPNSEDLRYTLSKDGTYYIVSGMVFSSYASHRGVWIPRYYNGLPIKEISPDAFAYDDYIYTVYINDFIEEIPAKAFYSCDALERVQFGASVKKICYGAFNNMQSLNAVYIPDSVEEIGEDAFDSRVTEVTGMKGVKRLGRRAFNSYYMTKFEIGNDIEYVEEDALSISSELEYNEYSGCCYVGNEENPYVVLVYVKDKTLTEYKIHPNTRIIYGTFENCNNVTELVVPDSVVSATGHIARYCNRLEKLTFSQNLTGVLYGAYSCGKLKSADIPAGISTIGCGAFSNCRELESVTIPTGVTEIEAEAFSGCDALTEVAIPEGVTYIGQWAFWSCDNLRKVSVPNSLERVSEQAFRDCGNLAYTLSDFGYYLGNDVNKYVILVSVDEQEFAARNCYTYEICSTTKIIYDYAFSGLKNLTEITVPDSVTMIGWRAFYECPDLTTVNLGSGVKEIGVAAFADCPNLKTITFGTAIDTIDVSAFQGCSSIEEIVLPDVRMTIRNDVFTDCTSLKKITLPGSGTVIEYDILFGCTALEEIIVPDSIGGLAARIVFGENRGMPALSEYEGGLYLGNAENPYAMLVGVVEGATELIVHEDTALFAIVYDNDLSADSDWLECVVLPQGVKSLSTFKFPGIGVEIYTYEESKPEYWGQKVQWTVYYYGEWTFVDGVPVANWMLEQKEE